MPKFVLGFAVNDLTKYRVAPTLADGNTDSGIEHTRFNMATSAISGLLDLGVAPPAAARLRATIRYKNTPTFAWHYSQDGATWTAANSSVTSGSATDTALAGRSCTYGAVDCVTTLAGSGVTARYWRVSVQDSDIQTGVVWQCGNGQPLSQAGLMEMRAENASGARLPEFMQILLAQEKVSGDGATASGGSG